MCRGIGAVLAASSRFLCALLSEAAAALTTSCDCKKNDYLLIFFGPVCSLSNPVSDSYRLGRWIAESDSSSPDPSRPNLEEEDVL